jgi:hypothetical protein
MSTPVNTRQQPSTPVNTFHNVLTGVKLLVICLSVN